MPLKLGEVFDLLAILIVIYLAWHKYLPFCFKSYATRVLSWDKSDMQSMLYSLIYGSRK